MKTLLTVFAVALLAASGAWFAARSSADSRLAALAAERDQLAAEKAGLERGKATAPPPSPTVVRVTETLTNSPAGPAANEILEILKAARVPAEGPQHVRALRDIVFHLETLARKGEPAVAPIRAFLAGFEDVEYSVEAGRADPPDPATQSPEQVGRDAAPSGDDVGRGRGGRGPGGAPWEAAVRELRAAGSARRERARFDFDVPPTLRAGLAEVLGRVASPEAEAGLVEMMRGSAKGFEVAYAARLLQAFAPDRHKAEAIAAATELLANPPEIAGKSRLDQRQKTYLYSVFELYGDSSFTDVAQRLLVGSDGKIDPYALRFLTDTLKEGAMPILYAAFNDPRLTNVWQKATLMERSLGYVGRDSSADAMLTTLMADGRIPVQLRAMTAGGLSRVGRGDPTEIDRPLLEGRLRLLQQIGSTATDEAIARAVARAGEDIQARLAGEDPEALRRERRAERQQTRRQGGQ